MQICGFNKTTLLDYPGHLACGIFLGGCNFRCPFCQNASLVLIPSTQPDISKETILQYLKKRQGILEGICISGGEPTLAPDLLDFMKEIKNLGYLIKLDTNGYRPDVIRAALDQHLIDYVAMDIKTCLDDYPRLCGKPQMDTAVIAESATLLQSSGITHEFRTTVVNPLHTPDSFEAIGQWLAGDSPYYLQEYRNSGDVIEEDGLSSYSDDEMEAFRQIVLPYLPNTYLRGV